MNEKTIRTDWWYTTQMYDMLFTPLVQFDSSYEQLLPALSTAWNTNTDTTKWTFHLRPDIVWHDGTAFTPEDVAFTYAALNDRSSSLGDIRFAVLGIQEVRTIDPFTVEITLSQPDDRLPQHLSAFYILPAHLLHNADHTAVDEFFKFKLVGTGAFKLAQVDANQITLARNSAYFRGEPRIEEIRIQNVPDEITRIELLGTYALDVIHVTVSTASSITKNASLNELRKFPDFLVFGRWWVVNNKIHNIKDTLGSTSLDHPIYHDEEKWEVGEQEATAQNDETPVQYKPVQVSQLNQLLTSHLLQNIFDADTLSLEGAQGFPSNEEPLQVIAPKKEKLSAKDIKELHDQSVAFYFLHAHLIDEHESSDGTRVLEIRMQVNPQTVKARFLAEDNTTIYEGQAQVRINPGESTEPTQVWFTVGNSHSVTIHAGCLTINIPIPWPPHN